MFQMHLVGVTSSYFVQWSPTRCHMFRVRYDPHVLELFLPLAQYFVSGNIVRCRNVGLLKQLKQYCAEVSRSIGAPSAIPVFRHGTPHPPAMPPNPVSPPPPALPATTIPQLPPPTVTATQNQGEERRIADETCHFCGTDDAEHWICCSDCDAWVCLTCSGLRAQRLQDLGRKRRKWQCKTCSDQPSTSR